MAKLPIDPVNTTSSSQYYTYVTGGSWELTAVFESERYIPKAIKDGGVDPAMFEIGSRLGIAPFVHGLVGYWKFDEGSGTTANDSSGFGNNGALLDASSTSADGNTPPQWTGGKVNHALDFDGDDDYVNVPNTPIFTPANNWSVSFWAKIDPNQTNWQGVIHLKSGDAWGIYASHFSKAFLYTTEPGTGATQPYFNSNPLSGLGSWIFYTLTKSGTIYKWHINGNLDSQQDKGAKDVTMNTGSTWQIGFDYSDRYKGLIDEVRVYNRALSAAEIKALYDATK